MGPPLAPSHNNPNPIPLPRGHVSTGAQYVTQPDLTPLAAYGATPDPTPTTAAPTMPMLAPANNNNNINNAPTDDTSEELELDADGDEDLDSGPVDFDPTNPTASPLAPAVREYPQSAYNYGTWTADDDRALVAARSRGQHWADLQRTYFPTKTANACRKRYERLMERRGVYDYDARKFERIAKEYMGMRKQIWSGLASRVGEKWPVVEAQVFFSPSFFFHRFWCLCVPSRELWLMALLTVHVHRPSNHPIQCPIVHQ